MASSVARDPRAATLLRRLVGASDDGPSTTSPDTVTFADWLSFATRERVVPLLYHLATSVEHELTATQLDTLERAQIEAMTVAALLDRQLVDVADILTELGIAFAALKGTATANLDYPDPSWRQYGDVDLLVAPGDLSAACRELARSGWHEWYPLPRAHAPFAHAVTLTRGRGWELDVHQRLAHRAVGLRIPVEQLMRDRVGFELAGVEINALSANHRLVHAAVHAEMSRLESRRLSSVADVLLLATTHAAAADVVVDVVDEWRIRPLFERSIRRAFAEADLPVPATWETAMSRPLAQRDRMIEWAYGGGRRRPVREELAHLRLIQRPTERWTYLRSLLVTDEEYERRSGRRGRMAQLRYLAGRLRDR